MSLVEFLSNGQPFAVGINAIQELAEQVFNKMENWEV